MATKAQEKAQSNSKIVFTYEGSEFTLEFDRASVAQCERIYGFSVQDVSQGKLNAIEGLFAGAFIKHHPNIKKTTVDMLYSHIKDKSGLFRTLAEMYGECVNELLEEPDEGNAISWAVQ